jgi:hypothetical protein
VPLRPVPLALCDGIQHDNTVNGAKMVRTKVARNDVVSVIWPSIFRLRQHYSMRRGGHESIIVNSYGFVALCVGADL